MTNDPTVPPLRFREEAVLPECLHVFKSRRQKSLTPDAN